MLSYALCIFIDALILSPAVLFIFFWCRTSEYAKEEIPVIVFVGICCVILFLCVAVWPA